jgi:hypothetical protein
LGRKSSEKKIDYNILLFKYITYTFISDRSGASEKYPITTLVFHCYNRNFSNVKTVLANGISNLIPCRFIGKK